MSHPYEEKLREFAQDEVMFEAVRGVFFSHCDLNRVADKMTTDDKNDDRLGAIFRGFDAARAIINETFNELEQYKHRGTPSTPHTNPV